MTAAKPPPPPDDEPEIRNSYGWCVPTAFMGLGMMSVVFIVVLAVVR